MSIIDSYSLKTYLLRGCATSIPAIIAAAGFFASTNLGHAACSPQPAFSGPTTVTCDNTAGPGLELNGGSSVSMPNVPVTLNVSGVDGVTAASNGSSSRTLTFGSGDDVINVEQNSEGRASVLREDRVSPPLDSNVGAVYLSNGSNIINVTASSLGVASVVTAKAGKDGNRVEASLSPGSTDGKRSLIRVTANSRGDAAVVRAEGVDAVAGIYNQSLSTPGAGNTYEVNASFMGHAHLIVSDERGVLGTGDGDDTITITARSNGIAGVMDANSGLINLGAGNDTITLNASDMSTAKVNTRGSVGIMAGAGDDHFIANATEIGSVAAFDGLTGDEGNDTVEINGQSASVWSFDGGVGNDTLILRDGTLKALFLGGEGDDSVYLIGGVQIGSASFDGGAGDKDTMNFERFSGTIRNGQMKAFETFNIDDSQLVLGRTVTQLINVKNSNVTLRDVTASAGVVGSDGSETITLQNATKLGGITLGGGEDRIVVAATAKIANLGTVDGGAGQDSLDLQGQTGSVADDQIVNIETISVTESKLNIGRTKTDLLNVDNSTLLLKDVSVSDAIIGVGGNETITIDGATRADRINLGGGDDTVIFTSNAMTSNFREIDGGSDPKGGPGNDRLHLSGQDSDLKQTWLENWELIELEQSRLKLDPERALTAGTLDIDAASHVTAIGNTTIAADVINAGTINLQDKDAKDLLTITGNYTGADGSRITGDIGFDGKSCPSDLVSIKGNASGSSSLQFSAYGASACNRKMPVVTVRGETNGTNFTGDNVIGGLYVYRLVYDQTDKTYKYVTSWPEPKPEPKPEPIVEPKPEPKPEPVVEPAPWISPTINGYANILSLAQLQGRSIADGLYYRLGGLRAGDARKLSREGFATWGRIIGGTGTIHPEPRKHADFDRNIIQAGIDFDLSSAVPSGTLISGVFGGYGWMNAAMATTPNLDINLKGGHAGIYASYWQSVDQGLWIDALAAYQFNEADLSAGGRHGASMDVNGWIGSVESSYRIAMPSSLSDKFWIAPVAQIIYQDVSFDAFTDNFGASVRKDSGDSLNLLAGIKLESEKELAGGTIFKPWVRMDLQYEALARNAMFATDGVNTLKGVSDMRGLSYRVSAGAKLEFSSSISAYGSVEYSGERTTELSGKLGLQVRF